MKSIILTILFAAAVGLGSVPAHADSGRKTIVLIFPVKLTGLTLSDAQRVQLRDYLDTRLTMEGVYKVMPEAQIKKDLGVAKVQSYNECYDEACRIDLTKTVYADRSVSVEVSSESKACRVTAKLYDIAQEATEAAADVITGCDFDAVKLSMVAVAQQLSGKAAPAIQKAATSSDTVFSIAALPAVPVVNQVGQISPRVADTGSWNDIDVAAYEAYDQVMQKDADASVSPLEKIKAWESLGGRFSSFAAQSSSRVAEWRKYVADKAEAERIEGLRRQRMEEDWSKLSRLLKLKVFSAEKKDEWARAFVEAYGEDRKLNPHAGDLGWYLIAPDSPSRAPVVTSKPVWVEVPGGTFWMGDDTGDTDEKPLHEVQVESFDISQSEVTVAQYKKCVDAGVCSLPKTGEECNWGVQGFGDHPVNCVDWYQAGAFASWVGGRLPTEVEWEYAARNRGRDAKYPWGNDPATCKNAMMAEQKLGCGLSRTARVCSRVSGNTRQNLCDMAGNVWEWVQDAYHESYKGAPSIGMAWEGQGAMRVYRGGSWSNDFRQLRATNRGAAKPGMRYVNLGFRVARNHSSN